jgi:glucuronate isomerase
MPPNAAKTGGRKMKNFMDHDFLLDTELAQLLYHNYAAVMPIIDYHCHMSPKDIAEDKKFENITQVWLAADHYKWRAMRSCGVSERLITGDADDFAKFEAFVGCMPSLIGHPVYHWSHLELKRYFGYEGVICPENCEEIWEVTKKALEGGLSTRKIIENSNVKLLCTTDDPADSLEYHIALRDDANFKTVVLPAFRPDKSLNIDAKGFVEYIELLSSVSGKKISSFDDLCDALAGRIEYFALLGCRTSDHSFDNEVIFDGTLSATDAKKAASKAFKSALAGDKLTAEDVSAYKNALIRFLGKEYVKHGFIMQIHFGAMRNTNSVMFQKLGPDRGYDTISGKSSTMALAAMLDTLNSDGALPRTVLYSLNPGDNEQIADLAGCFQYASEESEGLMGLPNVVQGAAWWFNDHLSGMKDHFQAYANAAAFGKFLGMLTDSRSALSYTRHEYFRRALCSFVAGFVERGEYPLDIEALAQMICDICYNNTKDFFGFKLV